MPLTVLQVAYSFAPLGPAAVGGAEEILGALDRALVAAGHRSLVVACEGSQVAGELFVAPLPDGPLGELPQKAEFRVRADFQAAIERALQLYPVDLVHMHGLDFAEYLLPAEVPVLVTLHMPVSWYEQRYPGLWGRLGRNVHLQCVSEDQRRSCPPALGAVSVIANGVDLPSLDLLSLTRPSLALPSLAPPDADLPAAFALVLGRLCPEKNASAALQAGTLAGMPVMIGGEVFPYEAHRRYFDAEIAPQLQAAQGSRHRFLGPLSPSRRQALLARAECLLHPTLAPETSSLVAMEALAAGTPVIAYPSGALPEILEHGRTGFFVNSPKSMARAIPLAATLSREQCRETAVRRFSRQPMLASYFALYDELTGRCSPAPAETNASVDFAHAAGAGLSRG